MTESLDVYLARSVRANRGDLASQAGIVQGLLRDPLVGRVYVSTYYPHYFSGQPRVVTIRPSALRGLVTNRAERWVLRSGIPALWGGGVDLQDTGGKIKMPLILLRILLLKRFGSPVVQVFQDAGPVRTRTGRFFLRRIARAFDTCVVRGPTARDLLVEQGGLDGSRIVESVDAALLLQCPGPDFGRGYLGERGLDPALPIMGLNLRRWFHQKADWLPTQLHRRRRGPEHEGRMAGLIDNVARAVASLEAAGYQQIVMVPMYRLEPEPWEDDILLLECMRERLPRTMKSVMVTEDLPTSNLLSIYACMSIMLGIRLHSTILAHVAGVPAVHIYYEHKGRDHFRHIGMEEYLVDIESASADAGGDALTDAVWRLHKERSGLSEALDRQIAVLRQRAERDLHQVLVSLMHGQGSHDGA